MNSFQKVIVIFVIVFSFGNMGLEAWRYYSTQAMLQDDVRKATTDSVELAMKDEFRQDKISVIDPDECIKMFNRIMQDTYNLDNNNAPIGDSYIVGNMVFSRVSVEKGKYHINGNGDGVQDVLPSLSIEGHITMRGLVLGRIVEYEVPFKATSKNVRYNGDSDS